MVSNYADIRDYQEVRLKRIIQIITESELDDRLKRERILGLITEIEHNCGYEYEYIEGILEIWKIFNFPGMYLPPEKQIEKIKEILEPFL